MDAAIGTQTLTERIIEAIILNGGTQEDIQYFTDAMITETGRQLAEKGIKERTPNPAFVVNPLNDIKGNMENFDWAYDKFAQLTFKVEASGGPKTIELIQCDPGETESILKQIDDRGFMPAPSPYVLGLGVQHPGAIEEYKYIVSLDEANLLPDGGGDPSFLDLYWYGERRLDLTRRAGGWNDRWWFAVVRK